MIPSWQQLSSRDRKTLLFGGAIVTALLLWGFVFDPLLQGRKALRSQSHTLAQDLSWMRSVAQNFSQRQNQTNTSAVDRAGRSLLALVDATARIATLGNAIQRIEPQADGQQVYVWIEEANFDTTMQWLEDLAAQYAVQMIDMQLDRSATPGYVNGRITLKDSSTSSP